MPDIYVQIIFYSYSGMKKITILIFFVCALSMAYAQQNVNQTYDWLPDSVVNTVVKHPTKDVVYIGGAFTKLMHEQNNLTILDTSTGLPALKMAKPNGTVKAIIKDGKGGWFIGGEFSKVGDSIRSNLAHLNPNGQVSSVFNDFGLSGNVNTLLLNGDTLFLGGGFTYQTALKAKSYVISYQNGIAQPISDISSVNGPVMVSIPDSNGGWYIGGSFTKVGEKSCSNIAHLDSAGNVLNWTCSVKGTVLSLALYQNGLIIGGDFKEVNGVQRDNLVLVDKNSGMLSGVNLNVDGRVNTIVVNDSYLYVGGFFSLAGGASRNNLASFNITSGLITGWNPNLDQGAIKRLLINNSILYVVGKFTRVDNETRKSIAAFNIVSGNLTNWNPEANDTINDICLHNNKAYIVGSFSMVNGQVRRNCAAIELSSGNLTIWHPNINTAIDAINFTGNSMLLGGDTLTNVDTVNGVKISIAPIHVFKIRTIGRYGASIFIGGIQISMKIGNARAFVMFDLGQNAPMFSGIDVNGTINDLEINNNILFAGGIFTSVNSILRDNVYAVSLNNMQLLPWNGGVFSITPGRSNERLVVNTIIKHGQHLYFAGQQFIFKLNPTNFQKVWTKQFYTTIIGLPDSVVTSLCVFNGKVYYGGYVRNSSLSAPNSCLFGILNDNYGESIPSLLNFQGTKIATMYQVASSGLLYVAGSIKSLSGVACRNIVGLNLHSNIVIPIKLGLSDWGVNESVTVSEIQLSGNALVLGGYFYGPSISRKCIAAFDTRRGKLIDQWNPEITGAAINTIQLNENKLYIGGIFEKVGPQIRNNLACVDDSLGNVTSFVANADSLVSSSLLVNGKLYLAGNFTTINGVARQRLASFDVTTDLLTNWSPFSNNRVLCLAYNHNSKLLYAGGYFTGIANKNRSYLAAIDSLGEATSWDPNPNNVVQAILVDSNNLFVGGQFTKFNGDNRFGLASFSIPSHALNNWGYSVSRTTYQSGVLSLGVKDSTLFIGGEFSNINGTVCYAFAGINKLVNTLPVVLPDTFINGNYTRSMFISQNARYLAGYFTFPTPPYFFYQKNLFISSSVPLINLVDSLDTDSSQFNVGFNGGTKMLKINSNTNWAVGYSTSWISTVIAYGYKNGAINITVQPNLTKQRRIGTVNISTGSLNRVVYIIQDSNSSYIKLNLDTLSFSLFGGTRQINVSSNVKWNIVNNTSWVIFNTSGDSGNKTVQVTTNLNQGDSRKASILLCSVVDTVRLAILQSPNDTILRLSVDTLRFTAFSESKQVVVTTRDNSNAKWNVLNNFPWVFCNTSNDSGTKAVQISTVLNQGNKRVASIFFYSVVDTIRLVIMQCANDTLLRLSVDTLRFASFSESKQLAISTRDSNTNWLMVASDPWIRSNTFNGVGSKQMVITVDANSSSFARTSIVSFKADSFICKLIIIQEPQVINSDSTTISLDTLFISANSGSYKVAIKSTVSWVTGKSGENWLNVFPTSGIGNDSLTIIVSNNLLSQRVGTIKVISAKGNPVIKVVQGFGTGINEVNAPSIVGYPNPTQDFIKLPKVYKYVYVYDESGKLLLQEKESSLIDCTKLTRGIYFLFTEEGYQRFVKY